MPTYFENTIDYKSCVGNGLSTINIDLTALDFNLSSLSSYTVNSVNFLSTTIDSMSALIRSEINYLSTTINTVSATLQTEINYVSSFVIPNYFTQGTIYQDSLGNVNWNFVNNGINAVVTLSTNGTLQNPSGFLFPGQTGNLMILSATSASNLTAFGNLWNFQLSSTSALNLSAHSRSRISYYWDGQYLLSEIKQYPH